MPRGRAEKLASILATFVSITEASQKTSTKVEERSEFQQVLYIYYVAEFDKFLIEMLIDSDSKINAMQWSFMKKVCFRICKSMSQVRRFKAAGQRFMG